jgi:hypothetical protein
LDTSGGYEVKCFSDEGPENLGPKDYPRRSQLLFTLDSKNNVSWVFDSSFPSIQELGGCDLFFDL